MLRVGFDLSQTAHHGGVPTYTKNLAYELAKLPNLSMTFFYSSLRIPYKGDLASVRSFRLPPSLLEILFNQWRCLPIEKFIGPIDVFHSSDWIQPPTKAKKVTTYHDVIPLKFPDWSHPKVVAVHKKRLQLVEKEIDKVIAVSQSTKNDLLEVTKIPENKIVVIYEGPTVSLDVRVQREDMEDELKNFRDKYKLPEKFILAIGGVGERKNLPRVKEACRDYNLVIAGETLPWLSERELGLLYTSAQVLLYPSFYEGFGLPILDAFIAGLPVVTSKVSSMPEVGGKAAMYVDPYNIEDIKEKLNTVLKDVQLRKEMVKKGFEQAKKFSWEKAAEQTAQLYINI